MRKYLQSRLSSPGILIFKEKHGKRYFVCNSQEDFCRAAMKILKERMEEGWYYDEEFTAKELAAQEAASYTGAVCKVRRLKKDATRAREIIERNDLEGAYEFMDDRINYEYEGMKIEHPEAY